MTLRIELSQNPTEEQRKAILEPLIAYNDAQTGGSTSEPFALLVRDEHDAILGLGIWLDTFDFQAPEFYKKLGFSQFGEIVDYPPGHSRHYFQKRLKG